MNLIYDVVAPSALLVALLMISVGGAWWILLRIKNRSRKRQRFSVMLGIGLMVLSMVLSIVAGATSALSSDKQASSSLESTDGSMAEILEPTIEVVARTDSEQSPAPTIELTDAPFAEATLTSAPLPISVAVPTAILDNSWLEISVDPIDVEYSVISNNIGPYFGRTLHFTGKVSDLNWRDDEIILFVNVTETDSGWTDPLLLSYLESSGEVVIGDIIEFTGNPLGREEYRTESGSTGTAPFLTTMDLRILSH